MNMKKGSIIIGLAVVAVIVLIAYLFGSTPGTATFVYPGGEFEVLVADSAIEQQRGLSGTQIDTLGADGMLFVFDDFKERTFWMNGMNYAIDVVWLRDNKVVKIQEDVPAPQVGEEPVKMHSRPFLVDMVLEVPAGTVRAEGITEGHVIEVRGL